MDKDQRAVQQIKAGQVRGLESLVQRYQQQAVRIAVLITRDPALAQDAAQDAFLRAYQQIHTFDATRPFAPWFFKIVSNLAVRAAQRASRSVPLEEDDSAAPLPDPAADIVKQVEALETADELRRAIDRLTPQQRAAFVLHYLDGLKEADVAAQLDAPPGTIKWRLFRARQRLQGWLGRL